MKVLVIIVTWNKKSYVIDLLHSLENLTFPRQKFDIVVVDNASDDGTVAAITEQFQDVHLIVNPENIGGTGGFNTGLSWAFDQPEETYDYLWLLDNDVQVHKNALEELVTLLEQHEDLAIAGSTMMQLTYPWRINEMGAFVERGRGRLMLNRHRQDVAAFKGKSLQELLERQIDLSKELFHCQPWMDVDYVAAASLLIRAPVARAAGLWDDFFIHYDDVEWCLRIAGMGYRVAVSARSLIWHLPAENKVPTWILYYDNRNVLSLLEKHSDKAAVKGTREWVLKKSLYYSLMGKQDIAQLHLQSVRDFDAGVQGKKEIQLDGDYRTLAAVEDLLEQQHITSLLIPWTIDLQACDLQKVFVQVMRKRADLVVDYLVPSPAISRGASPGKVLSCQLPGARPLHISDGLFSRFLRYVRLRGRYDLVLQSDYRPLLPLSWLGKNTLFVNYEGICLRPAPGLKTVWKHIKSLVALYFRSPKRPTGEKS